MSEGFDPQALLAQALEMQQRLMDAEAEAASESVEGSSGGGKVRITMTGTGEVTAVRIDPSVVVPAEVDLLEDLIVAALHDAAGQVAARAEQGLGGLGDLLGGGGLEGALGGLFGGGGGGGSAIEAGSAPSAGSGPVGQPGQLPPAPDPGGTPGEN